MDAEAGESVTREQLEGQLRDYGDLLVTHLITEAMEYPEGLAICKNYFAKVLQLQTRAMKAGLLDAAYVWVPQATNEPFVIPPSGRWVEQKNALFELSGRKPVTSTPAEVFHYPVSTEDFFGRESFGSIGLAFNDAEFDQMVEQLTPLVIENYFARGA